MTSTAEQEQLDLISDVIRPTARQKEFLETIRRKRFVLYGGAMGGGKSYILRWWLVKYLIELAKAGIENAAVGLFCEDYPSLADRHVSKIKFEFPAWLGSLSQSTTRDFVLNPEYGSGRICLRNLDDPSKYQSAEFAAIAVDELTKNDRVIFDFLRTRLRWPGVDRPRFAAATNPGGVGHAWVRDLWIDGKFPDELQPLASEFGFIPARAEDNPHLSAAYYENLKTLPPAMAKTFAEGRWDAFAGQYFDIFDPRKHTVRAETIQMKAWWPRWISIDWGFEHDSAIYWHTQDGSRTLTYREMVVNHLSPVALGQAIAERCKDEKIAQIFLSPDAFAHRTTEASIAEQLGGVFADGGLPRPIPADDDRIGGWMLMYQLLESQLWTIATNCHRLIACLPALTRDEKKVEDCVKFVGDDPADAARYGLKSRLQPGGPPIAERIEQRIAAMEIKDPTSEMIFRSKIEREEWRKSQPVHFGRLHKRRWRMN